jgi:LDH2 family malate/lactate/ureidoglycolate dehydrogenase
LVNNMLTLAFDPAAFAGADFAADITRFSAWVKESPPLAPGGVVELPGDIERRTMQHRRAAGIPLDPVTISELTRTAQLLSVDLPSELTS